MKLKMHLLFPLVEEIRRHQNAEKYNTTTKRTQMHTAIQKNQSANKHVIMAYGSIHGLHWFGLRRDFHGTLWN